MLMSDTMCLKTCFELSRTLFFSSWKSQSSGPTCPFHRWGNWEPKRCLTEVKEKVIVEPMLRPDSLNTYLFSALMSPENMQRRSLMSLIWPLVYWELEFLSALLKKRYGTWSQETPGQNSEVVSRKAPGGPLDLLLASVYVCKMERTPTSCASRNIEGFIGGYREGAFLFCLCPHSFPEVLSTEPRTDYHS